jgi:hypothetical protein
VLPPCTRNVLRQPHQHAAKQVKVAMAGGGGGDRRPLTKQALSLACLLVISVASGWMNNACGAHLLRGHALPTPGPGLLFGFPSCGPVAGRRLLCLANGDLAKAIAVRSPFVRVAMSMWQWPAALARRPISCNCLC